MNESKENWIVDESNGDKKVTKINQYGDRVDGFLRPDQLELGLNSLCAVIFRPNDYKLFEIAGDSSEDAIHKAKLQVSSLISEWNGLPDKTKECANEYMKHFMTMVLRHDALEYRVIQ